MKNFIYTLRLVVAFIILVNLISCGSQGGSSGSDQKEEAKKDEVAPLQSISLKNIKDLPKCAKANDSQLVYVIDDQMFMTCTEGEWVEIEMPTQETERVVSSSFWADPVTGTTWYVGSYAQWTGCDNALGELRSATQAETIEAINNGIFEGATSIAAWIDSDDYVLSANPSVLIHNTNAVKAITLCIAE